MYKQAYTGLSRPTWLLSLVMLVNRSGTMVIPFMTIYLTQSLHYSIAEAGFVIGLFGAGAIAGAFMGGWLTDRFSFYPIQLITLTGGGLLFIVLGQMHSYALICLFTFLLSLVNEAFRPANAAAIAHYSTGANRTRSYSLNRLAINLGWAAGGVLGGFIASYNYSLLFWVDGLTNISAAVLMRVFLPAPAFTADSAVHQAPVTRNSVSAYRDKTYLYFIGLTTVFAICFFQLFTTLPVYYKQELHLSVIFIGILMAMNGVIIAFLEMITVYKLEGKRADTWYISFGVLLVGFSYVVLNLFNTSAVLVAIISMLLISFGEILAMPFMNAFWVGRTTALNRGQYASLYSMAYAVAHVIGPTLGSQIVVWYSFNTLWWVIGGMSLVSGLCFLMMKQQAGNRAHE